MQNEKQGPRFWLGNAVLAIALVMLLFMGTLWEHIGVWAMGVWAVVAGIGAYLVMTDKGGSPNGPN
jgi:hypothetical protein